MDFLDIVVKAIVITFAIYGVISFIYNVRDERARRKTIPPSYAPRSKKVQVDLNPTEFPISAYTEQKDTAIPPSYAPRSKKAMELS